MSDIQYVIAEYGYGNRSMMPVMVEYVNTIL